MGALLGDDHDRKVGDVHQTMRGAAHEEFFEVRQSSRSHNDATGPDVAGFVVDFYREPTVEAGADGPVTSIPLAWRVSTALLTIAGASSVFSTLSTPARPTKPVFEHVQDAHFGDTRLGEVGAHVHFGATFVARHP